MLPCVVLVCTVLQASFLVLYSGFLGFFAYFPQFLVLVSLIDQVRVLVSLPTCLPLLVAKPYSQKDNPESVLSAAFEVCANFHMNNFFTDSPPVCPLLESIPASCPICLLLSSCSVHI